MVLALMVGSATFCTVGGGLAYRAYSIVPKGPPAFIVNPASRRIVAQPGVRVIHATYEVTNSGGSDLILGDALTTCGCSVASIEPKVLRPREVATVRVDGHPPDLGQKTVQISIPNNAHTKKQLTLVLTMIGTKPAPYVSVDSGAVHFGEIGTDEAQERVYVETREMASGGPWIARVGSSLPEVAVTGGLENEEAVGDGTVHRRYSYVAKLARRLRLGALHGELLFFAADPRAAPIVRLPVHGSVRAPVFSIPSSLYATWDRAEESPKLTLVLAANDRHFRLEAEPAADNVDFIEVRPVGRVDGRNTFEVSMRKAVDGPLSTNLTFRTNHPEMKRIQVPLTVSLSDRN